MLEDLLIPGSPLHCPHLSFPLPGIFLHPFLPACHHQLAQPKAGAPVPGWQGGEEQEPRQVECCKVGPSRDPATLK